MHYSIIHDFALGCIQHALQHRLQCCHPLQAKAMIMATTGKNRTVLIIHGWAQNAYVMKSRTKKLHKRISELGYDCIYLEAPHLLPMTSMIEVDGQLVEVTNGGRQNAKAWFMYSEKDPSDASNSLQEAPMEYFGLDASISMIRDCLCKLDTTSCTIFGFSQGATFVHILSMLASIAKTKPDTKHLSPFAKVDSAILASGFASMHQGSMTGNAHASDCEGLITIRSLHIIGDRDTSVPNSYGNKLASLYSEPQMYIHNKGHFIPHNKELIDTVIEFLEHA